MADCNNLFIEHNKNISLTKTKKNSLKKSKDACRTRIRQWFAKNKPSYVPKFFIQGSYKCKNAIAYEDGTCDLDDGVYFLNKPDVSGTTLQSWVLQAVTGLIADNPKHLKKCIRVLYRDNYNIDLPVFYFEEGDTHPNLAVKNSDFTGDDPKEFVEWHSRSKDEKGQLLRITKYLKNWARNKSHKMPNGLCLTILAQKNIHFDSRDDVCLNRTLTKMYASLFSSWMCKMPTFPFTNLFLEYDDVLKRNFLSSLKEFIEDSDRALVIKSEYKASIIWQKHLGKRFPLGKKTEDEEKNEALLSAALAINSGEHYTSNSGQINNVKQGVKNQQHRFYGE